MLKNYFKIAIAVLLRKKFFTFISLFGISFTLTILMVLTAFIDKIAGDNYPDKKRDRSLYISALEETNAKRSSMSGGKLSFYFLDHYAGGMKTPVKVAISSVFDATKTYVNGKKINIDYKYTNADYWDVLDYTFLEGRPYSRREIDNGDRVAIISQDMKNAYFGDIPSVLGKDIEADNISYRVVGVVQSIPVTTYMMYGDLYLPYTVSKRDFRSKSYLGDYTAILLAASTADVPKMRREFDEIVRKLPMETGFDHIYSHAEAYLPAYVNDNNEKASGVTILVTAISIFVFLLMLLPTLNLVNINITRIMERSSEIGIRKAFGASSRTLVYQFLVENIILTLLGGLLGVFLSFIAIQALNSFHLIAHFDLSLNLTVLFYGLLACLLFGLLSGVYPSWRMSRLNVVNALKA
jgi:putative ABC transport system permease protein